MKKILILLQKIIDKLNSKLINYLFYKYDYYIFPSFNPYLKYLDEKVNSDLIYSDFWNGSNLRESDFE